MRFDVWLFCNGMLVLFYCWLNIRDVYRMYRAMRLEGMSDRFNSRRGLG